jgi:hypothetical protein
MPDRRWNSMELSLNTHWALHFPRVGMQSPVPGWRSKIQLGMHSSGVVGPILPWRRSLVRDLRWRSLKPMPSCKNHKR